MTAFEDFVCDLERLVCEHARKGLTLKLEADREHDMVRILEESVSPIIRARRAMEHVIDVANNAAEHHPSWPMLAHSAEIAASVLEKWDGDLTDSELDEIKWHIQGLDRSVRDK